MIGTRRIKWGGAVIGTLGFVLARTALLNTASTAGARDFVLGAVLPLVFGLGLTALGVGLAVSTLDRSYVRTVTTWCLLGVGGMGLTAGVTIATAGGSLSVWAGDPQTDRLLVNVLIAGAVGGTLIGLRSAANSRHRREAARRAAQSTVLNRLLRHEVLNAVQVIHGYAERSVEADPDPSATRRVLRSRASEIADTIDDIGFLIGANAGSRLHAVALESVLREQVDQLGTEYPDARVTVDTGSVTPDTQVWATDEVAFVVDELVGNALEHSDADPPAVTVRLAERGDRVVLTVEDNGPGLDDQQRGILEGRHLPEYDDPTTGFGIPRTRLLLDEYGATVTVETPVNDGRGTRIEVTFARAGPSASPADLDRAPGDELRRLGTVGAIATVSGLVMGGVLWGFTSVLPVIGGLYGLYEPAVGWVFHLFHSVVFGLVFAAAVEWAPLRDRLRTVPRYTLAGTGYGVLLWFLAAGIVMPLWSSAVGTDLMVPFLTVPSLVGHLVWGGLFGAGVGLWELQGGPTERRVTQTKPTPRPER